MLSNGVVAFPYVFETHKDNFKVDVVSVGALLGFSLCWLLSLWSVVSRCTGFTPGGTGLRGCSSPAPACSVVWHADSAAHCTWGLPGPGMEPVSFELVGGFFATEPPRKPFFFRLLIWRKKEGVPNGVLTSYVGSSLMILITSDMIHSVD